MSSPSCPSSADKDNNLYGKGSFKSKTPEDAGGSGNDSKLENKSKNKTPNLSPHNFTVKKKKKLKINPTKIQKTQSKNPKAKK